MSRINDLRELDPEVWILGAARKVQSSVQPLASIDQIQNNNFICYRGVYYWSNIANMPYVCLKFWTLPTNRLKILQMSEQPLPLVRCCSKQSYDKFLQRYDQGLFQNLDLIIG